MSAFIKFIIFFTANKFFFGILVGEMARPFSFIADLNEKKDFWKLAVKVVDRWNVVKDGKEHSKMVIVDVKVILSTSDQKHLSYIYSDFKLSIYFYMVYIS